MTEFTHLDLLAIKNEFFLNPLELPYLAFNDQHDAENADQMNEVRASLLVWRNTVPLSEIGFDVDEFFALAPGQRDWINLVTRDGAISPAKNDEVRDGLLGCFGEGTKTRANLEEVLRRPGSRGEQLEQESKLSTWHPITPSEIARARAEV